MRRVRLSVAALLSASLLLAGCGGDDPEPEPAAESPAPTEAPAEPATWPLTGEETDDEVEKKHPPIVVKIDNTANSSPQVGLGSADVVVEQMVEGGGTRLAVMFYSQLPRETGPVRSMRATDIGIAAPVEGAIVASGAAGETFDRVRRAGLPIVEEGARGIARVSGRPSLYSVMADLREVAKGLAGDGSSRPADYFPFGDAADLPEGRPATQLSASYPARTTTWAFEGGSYVNTNSYAAEGDEFTADNVLVLRVKVVDAGYTDAAGTRVPESRFEGRGQAMLFHGGEMVRGTWRKDGLDGDLALQGRDGDIVVPPGRTWVHLLPLENSDVTFE